VGKEQGGYMTQPDFIPLLPEELKPIVATWGGPENFARIIQTKQRTVESWLYGERNIKPPVAMLIRSLKPPRAKRVQSLAGEV
jgi:hypothetical protein